MKILFLASLFIVLIINTLKFNLQMKTLLNDPMWRLDQPDVTKIMQNLSAFANINKMNCELMLTYDIPALRQTGSWNLTGQKTLPTIWGTYMKLVTKYQISVVNS